MDEEGERPNQKSIARVSSRVKTESVRSIDCSGVIGESYYENDVIVEPELKPLENSYYRVDEIEAKIKNKNKPMFK